MYKSVELKIGDKVLRGCVRLPEGEGPFPTVCFYHGFSVDKVGLMRLHELFARRCVESGFACVRFDFYGCGESDGDFSAVTFSAEVEQATAIAQWCREQPYVQHDALYLSGHSMGGAIVSVIAPHVKPKAAILWSAGNSAYYDISARVHAVPGRYKASYDIGGLELSGTFFDDIRTWDIVEKSRGYEGPVLLVHGECDEKIPIASIGPYMDMYGDQVNVHIVDGANHQFSSLEWKKEVYDVTMAFLNDLQD